MTTEHIFLLQRTLWMANVLSHTSLSPFIMPSKVLREILTAVYNQSSHSMYHTNHIFILPRPSPLSLGYFTLSRPILYRHTKLCSIIDRLMLLFFQKAKGLVAQTAKYRENTGRSVKSYHFSPLRPNATFLVSKWSPQYAPTIAHAYFHSLATA